MDSKDLVRLKHMRDSAEAILSFIKGKRRTSLDKERLILSAVLRELEIIGEEASPNKKHRALLHYADLRSLLALFVLGSLLSLWTFLECSLLFACAISI